MSESTSSPLVQVLSPSPTNSAPCSDEEPDLGSFSQNIREWTYLQPHPRVPVQIRPPTASTTPTYQAEQSLVGDDMPTRIGNSRSGLSRSSLSSFTRPPTSSIHPDDPTVWVHPPIASYLISNTPSMERSSDEEERVEVYSPTDSQASTALTVDIASDTFLDDESHHSNGRRDDLSPDTDSVIPVSVVDDSQRLDSRNTAHTEDDIDSLPVDDRGIESSEISPFFFRPPLQERTIASSSQDSSEPSIFSVQLQSQAAPAATTIRSSSTSLSEGRSMSISIAEKSTINSIDSAIGPSNTSGSTATLMNAFLNRSQNPIPPPTNDSSCVTSGAASSSGFSLVTYRMTPSVAVEQDDSELGRSTEAIVLRTQQSISDITLSDSTSVLASERILLSSVITSTVSPLPNPHSLPPTPESLHLNTNYGHVAPENDTTIVVGTPPSEVIVAPRRIFEHIRDDETEQNAPSHSTIHLSTPDSHYIQCIVFY